MLQLELLKKVAEGSVAEAFLARQPGVHDTVLVELSRPALAHDTEMYGRFLDAARERQKLHHPNVLQRLSTGCQNDGRLYVVTEPVGGESLQARLESHGPLPLAEAVKLVSQLCEGVDYLHTRGLVHGNLRPANVFLAPHGEPKLLDMGLLLFRTTRSMKTPTSLVLVAPEYLSPERIKGHRATRLSDVYGLGVLLYELLSGQPPFHSENLEDTRRLHLTAPVPWLPPGTEHLAGFMARCLAKDPERRFVSVVEMREALLSLPLTAPRTPHSFDPTINLRAPADLPIVEGRLEGPDVLGSYELQQLIGEGGMGHVYLARHLTLDRKVAIKVLRPELARVEHQVQRFFQEAKAVNKVNHPHIVEIHDFIEDRAQNKVWCVMEYLPGESLKTLGRKGPLPVTRAVGIVRQVAQALAAAHKVGVVHRDIKPDNIYLVTGRDERDFVKVLDFGIAKLRTDNESAKASSTVTGEVIGTPAYMAPEQALGLEVDQRSDLYALGTVLYVLLAGRFPFDGASASQIVANLVTQPPRPLGLLSASGEPTPDGLRELVMRCLDKLPQARFQSMEELDLALAEFDSVPMLVDDDDLIQVTETPAVPLQVASVAVVEALPEPVPLTKKKPTLEVVEAKPSRVPWLMALLVLVSGAAAAWYQPWHWPEVQQLLERGQGGPVSAVTPAVEAPVELKAISVDHGPVQKVQQVDPPEGDEAPAPLDEPQLMAVEALEVPAAAAPAPTVVKKKSKKRSR